MMGEILLNNLFQLIKYDRIQLIIILFLGQITSASVFFVNDNSLKGDIYTSSIGTDFNDGKSADSPKLSLLSAYNIAQENDIIYVDTGTYIDIDVNGNLKFENKKNVKIIIAGFNDELYSKTALPTNEKINPAIFYVKDDKPIDRDNYSIELQNNKK